MRSLAQRFLAQRLLAPTSVLALVAALGLSTISSAALAATGDSSSTPTSTSSSPRTGAALRAGLAATPAEAVPATAITFDEVPLETILTDEYVGSGVEFTSDVFTTEDTSADTNPVLSGDPKFFGAISGRFVDPVSGNPTTVLGFSLDVGYIDSRDSVEVTYYAANGSYIGSRVAQSEGFNHIEADYAGIASFTVDTVFDEPSGFEIDNLFIKRQAAGVKPTRMISLGDSYSSGEGLLPRKGGPAYDCATDLAPMMYADDTTALYGYGWAKTDCDTRTLSTREPADLRKRPMTFQENNCHRGGYAYPNQIRSRLGIKASNALFIACSGAVTADVLYGAQYPDSPVNVAGGQRQNKGALDFKSKVGMPDLVTIGIGGNDAGFKEIIEECMHKACAEDSTYLQGVIDRINSGVFSNVRDTFDTLRSEFPLPSTIVAFGYPSVIGDPATDCGGFHGGPVYRVEESEREWLKDTMLPALNSAIQDAAAEAGISYVDITQVTAGHEICSAKPWVNGLMLDWLSPMSESFHPNQDAHAAITNWFMSHYVSNGKLTFVNPESAVSIRPGTGPSLYLGKVAAGAMQPCGAGCATPVPCVQSCPVTVQGTGYEPGSTLTVTLHSTPVVLGTLLVDPLGRVRGRFTVPKGTPPGLHFIELSGDDSDGYPQYGSAPLEIFKTMPASPRALRLTLAGAAVQRLKARHVSLTCKMTLRAACRTVATVRVGGKTYRAVMRKTPRSGGFVVLSPRFSKAVVAKINKALKAHKKVVVTMRTTATYGAKTSSAVKVVRLKR